MADPEEQAAAEASALPSEAPPAGPPPRPAQTPPGPPPGEREPHKPGTDDLAVLIEQAWADLPHESKFNFGDLEIALDKEHLPEACKRARSDGFGYFMCLTATDYESYIELVYHLYSYRDHRRLTLRTKLDADKPSIPTVTNIWRGADWHEREAAEMLGMEFPGHPDPRPLLLDDDIDERPLRKSHPLVPVYEDRPGIVRRPIDSPA